MMLLAIIWVTLAPLALVAAIALLAWATRRLGRWASVGFAAAIVLAPVGVLWSADHREFRSVCEREGAAVVHATAQADGILLSSTTSNSFGMRYLHSEGFSWVEADDIYDRRKWVRYQRGADGNISTVPIEKPTARYEVREQHTQPFPHTSVLSTVVIDREAGTEMARAASAHFHGGRARWALGMWGSDSCPDVRQGDGFNRFYHLARNTLRGAG